jgi:hypothetical protein
VSGVPPEAHRNYRIRLTSERRALQTPQKTTSENQPGENVTPNSYFFRTLLVLLCYKQNNWYRIVLWANTLRQAHRRSALRHI